MGGRRKKIGLTKKEEQLLAAIRGWGDKETVRAATRVKHGSSVSHYQGPSELAVVAGLAEKLEPLRKARKREAEAKRDERTY